MKKSNLIQIITILLVSIMVMLFSTSVNAETTLDPINMQALESNSNSNSANNTNTNNTNTNNTNKANKTNNTNTNNTNKANNINNTNNSSVYNNNNLPKTGIEDSIPVAALVVVFGVSAVYAYRKIKEYKNI